MLLIHVFPVVLKTDEVNAPNSTAAHQFCDALKGPGNLTVPVVVPANLEHARGDSRPDEARVAL